MACVKTTVNKAYKIIGLIALFIIVVLSLDLFTHYDEYVELDHCQDTFGGKCKLIAVPDDFIGLTR